MRRWIMLTLAAVAGVNSFVIRAAHAAPAVVAHVVDSLRGRVTTDGGEPVSAVVSLVVPASSEVVARTRTTRDGRYVLAAPRREGGYLLRVVSIGYHPVVRRVEWDGDAWRAPGDIAMRSISAIGGMTSYGVQATK